MDDYAGRVLADRYRLPLPPSDEYELTETRAFDTYSGQEVLIRQVPLPEVVEAEVLDADGLPDGFTARDGRGRAARGGRTAGEDRSARTATRRPADPAVRRAVEAVQAVARIPDHPRLDQVFDVFVEDGSLWIVSELVAARPLAALLAEQPLTPYRAAEVASDILMALRVLHAHGWVHRNITARTVLVCDDGRVILTGLAVGAAEEALCGYDPVPVREAEDEDAARETLSAGEPDTSVDARGSDGPGGPAGPGTGGLAGGIGGPAAGTDFVPADPEAARRAAIEARAARPLSLPGAQTGPGDPGGLAQRAPGTGEDIRAARAAALAAYREGAARAAARAQEAQQGARAALPGARRPAEDAPRAGAVSRAGTDHEDRFTPPGQIADPYGVRSGTASRTGTGLSLPAAGAGRSTAFPGSEPAPAVPSQSRSEPGTVPARWDAPAGTPAPRGPATALEAERARQARMAVVGPVTERWAPEQAGPVHENWQLAAPIGPATDLWALGALLFRAVQGHAPYPEESTAELVQMVCAEPPAYAEECGPLRPIVESLLRQDPTERPDFEELRGWLRSLVRSAPEPEAGTHVIVGPPAGTGRLPVVRRRGELVRRRRAGLPVAHGRHKRARQRSRSPRRLGCTLLLLIMLMLAAAIAYAMLFMPKAGQDGATGGERTGTVGEAGPAPTEPDDVPRSGPPPSSSGTGNSPSESAGSTVAQTTAPVLADGFVLREDPAGFRIAVAEGWTRAPRNDQGRIVYSRGSFELIVVPGRDSAAEFGSDPMVYQREKESELQGYRSSSWSTSAGLRTVRVGGRTMAEGQFTWTGANGQQLFVRNLAILLDGRYHVVQVRGPEAQRDRVTELYEQAAATYQYTG
ncbi:serine/threonine protein kinase [Streptomyces sp. F-3]|uniref:Protein kinase n=1 Tax=Streptomyces thermogriseus TaxID=75292 RepID=A0ABN1T5N6_9ACTN|nr:MULTISPECIES: protein kinase [unclassified Streptomyces]MDN5384313.1 protein kinase [Streptomyces sp. LB8]GAT82089.1 serine/threonine protein kinase [Streptomyces sp. F-3]